MRSLATIRSGGGTPGMPSTPSMSYISRTLPRAIRGSSSSVAVTWRDATESSGDVVETREDLVGGAHVVGIVEHRVEREPARALVGGEQLAQGDAVVRGALRELLDDAVGLVARGALLDEREQHALGEERSVRELEVGAHALGVDGHALHERDRAVLEVVEQDRRVGQDHALDGGVGDVTLVPQGDVLERRLGVAAQDACETGDLLALDGVALVRHRGGALLPGAERL